MSGGKVNIYSVPRRDDIYINTHKRYIYIKGRYILIVIFFLVVKIVNNIDNMDNKT